MGILKIFSGKDPEDYEQKGDSYFEAAKYGCIFHAKRMSNPEKSGC